MRCSSLIVSLHDVSPLTWEAAREILRDLAACGVRKTSLLVIPDHHHRSPLLKHPAFCEWLRERSGEGHEIVTHGYFHQRERSGRESAQDKMITRVYTAGEGEFYDLGEEEALRKMQRAQADFAAAGLQSIGFIAPAWLLSAGAERAAQAAGFRYTTTLRELRDLRGTHSARSQSLVYSVRSAWRRAVSVAWNRALAARLEANAVARLGIHPPDWRYPRIQAEILRLARTFGARREIITYADWMAP